MAGLKQIMEIFMTINQPLSSEQRVRWYIQREVPTDFPLCLFKLTIGKSEFFDNSARSRWIFLQTAGMVCC